MTKFDVSVKGSTGDTLRAHVQALSSMLAGEHVNITETGKLYGRITRALLDAIEQGGHSSLRFRAAAKALDLKTPKSQLLSFVGDAPARGHTESV
jgi:hypothetical protein